VFSLDQTYKIRNQNRKFLLCLYFLSGKDESFELIPVIKEEKK